MTSDQVFFLINEQNNEYNNIINNNNKYDPKIYILKIKIKWQIQ